MSERNIIKYNIISLKIIVILNLMVYSKLSECPKELPILKDNNCSSILCEDEEFNLGLCTINNSIIKTQWLNNIIKFENTNGEVFLDVSKDLDKLVFSTILPDNNERIIYVEDINKRFFFQNYNNEKKSFIKKSLGIIQNTEISNKQICLAYNNYNYIILINSNSDIQILNLDLYENNYLFITQSNFLNENKTISGKSFYCKNINTDDFYFASITAQENNSSNYSLSLFSHKLLEEGDELMPIYLYSYEITDIKGEYISCFVNTNNIYFSCFYLNNNNTYLITLFLIKGRYFQKNNTLIVGNSSEFDEDKFYFFKGISITNTFAIYAYYSGDYNEIPTFIFKSIDNYQYTFSDKFPDLPIVQLYDYEFSNDIKYNDLIKFDTNEFFFISTSKNKETLIIADLNFFLNENLAIRYFTINLRKYYNMKIFQGIKASFYNDFILTLAIDYFYCSNELCGNTEEENGNAGLIFLSYVNKTNVNIDFIDYSFTYNRNYILIDLADNYNIENNIFGMYLYEVLRGSWENEIGIEYYYLKTGENIIEDNIYYFYPNDSKIIINFLNYSLNQIDIDVNYKFKIKTSPNITEFNKYTSKVNNSYGETDKIESYSPYSYTSSYFHYYININLNLSFECNDSNCTLCLRNDSDYCLVCNDEYTILYNEGYYNGKKKICQNISKLSDIATDKKAEEFFEQYKFNDFLSSEYKDTNLTDKEIKALYKEIKDYLINRYEGNDTIITTGNVKVQISSIDSQQNLSKISDIDLGECGEILKKNYGYSKNNSLTILKFDIRPKNEKSTYVQYKIYDPNTKIFLELKECIGSNIVINIPIDLNTDIESLYDELSQFGYNLFDSNNSFYNDICATYTTQNGTDILLYDRRMDIYQLTINISLCQKECKFESYNLETKKAKCNCPPQTKEINTNTSELIFDTNKMINEFYEILKNSNFKVLQCYKLPFNLNVFIKNIGSISMTILLVSFLALIIYYVTKSSRELKFHIQSILNMKFPAKKRKKPKNNNSINTNIDKIKDKKNKFFREINKNNKNDINNVINNFYNFYSPQNKKRKRKIIKKTKTKIISFNHDINNLKKENETQEIADENILRNNNIIKFPPKRKATHNEEDFTIESDNKRIINKKISNKSNIIITNNISLDFVHNILNNDYTKVNNNNEKNKNEKKDINIFPIRHKKSFKDKIRKRKLTIKKSEINDESQSQERNTNLILNQEEKKSKNDLNYNILAEQNSDKISIENLKKKIKKNASILNDQEKNSLDYEKAIKLDKRSYFQYYWSILKKNQLILFTFLPANDYNIMSSKISLFIVSFSLYFTINLLFFSDTTMHKIYISNGVFNLMHQIPQLFYSSIIPTIINIILKTLSLSEKDILRLKQEEDMTKFINDSKKVERCIIIKFIIFFIVSLLLMLFFWYFVSCFCAVYINTQIILIKDILISFSLSMAYPFGLNLIPGLLRIPALRDLKKNKEGVYKISQYLALIF